MRGKVSIMRLKLRIIAFCLAVVFLAFLARAIEPNGASITVESSERMPSGDAGNHSAIAGNITEITIYSGATVSRSWQGYYGNVTGGLRLADASGDVIYNWSLVSSEGEVYASVNSTISWANIQCFNFTAMGNYSSEAGSGGTTNLYGTNVSILESQYGISSDDLDGVNSTFRNFNHDSFYTANQQFSADECHSVQLFTNNSVGEDGIFEEILLYEPVTSSVVFTSIIETNAVAFNGHSADFQMMVLDDGHGIDTATTAYYFFTELE